MNKTLNTVFFFLHCPLAISKIKLHSRNSSWNPRRHYVLHTLTACSLVHSLPRHNSQGEDSKTPRARKEAAAVPLACGSSGSSGDGSGSNSVAVVETVLIHSLNLIISQNLICNMSYRNTRPRNRAIKGEYSSCRNPFWSVYSLHNHLLGGRYRHDCYRDASEQQRKGCL